MTPDFVDNQNGNTLASAIAGYLEWLTLQNHEPVSMSIATGYFNIEGFALLANHLERRPKVRLLLGAEPLPPPARPVRKPGDPKGPKFEAQLLKSAIVKTEQGIIHDRDLLEFSPATDAAIKRLLALLQSGRLEVRRYEKAFLHGKAYLFEDSEGAIAGSSNFTAGGLRNNLELNLGRYDSQTVTRVQEWFEKLWQDAEPYDLAAIYAARYAEYQPYIIYLRVLWELYGAELEEEAEVISNSRIRLTSFQTDGLWRARRILNEYNGVLVADGVGLGKSFIAGAIIEDAINNNRQRVLLVAPAALRDGMWHTFNLEHQLGVECISYEQLAADQYRYPINDYAMVVVDESQAVRNPEAQRTAALRRLLQGQPPKKLVLLTATPVNNSLWDLYYLITLFAGHDGVFADRGIRSLKDCFREAAAQDPNDLSPEMLFDVLDSVTVRRTRHFVKRYYPNDRVIGPGGREIAVQFPEPHVSEINYSLDDVLPGFVDELEAALAPEDEHTPPRLTMARYCPSRYLRGQQPNQSQLALVGLVSSGLLKRFESSVHAFARTARKMVEGHDAFLAALDRGRILTPEAMEEWGEIDNDEEWDRVLRESGAEDVKYYDVKRLRADVISDRDNLNAFATKAATVAANSDPKLLALTDALVDIVKQAKKDAVGDDDFRNKRKVIIFSYFADTAEWIEAYITKQLAAKPELKILRDRLVSVAGQSSRGGVNREDAVFGFAPISTQAPAGRSEDRFDIVVTTDVLAEGVNLQQCRNIINYDLPWNPMRLVQRHGRVDRIGSPHADVYLHCFMPDDNLDRLLQLEARLHRKIKQAAASIGVENEVIPGAVTNDLYFTETREQIERLRQRDPSLFVNGGEDPSGHSGEEYRQELRRAMQTPQLAEMIRNLAWGAGSGLARGKQRGHFFCARVGERLFLRFVPFGMEQPVIERNTLRCLKKITCLENTPRQLPDDLKDGTYAAWTTARADILSDWLFTTDPANIQPRIRPFFRRAADHLRKNPPHDMTQDAVDRAIDSLEAPWGMRHERAMRGVFDAGDDAAVSKAILEKVSELGMQPFVQPKPLPVITESEVSLVCWMAVDMA